MNYRKTLFLAALLVLTACRDPGPDVANDGAGLPPDGASPVETAAVPEPTAQLDRKTTFESPVAGAISGFPFAYHVAVDRKVTNRGTGQSAREIGIEFLNTTVANANQNVAEQLALAGFSVESSEPQGKAIRSVYTKDGHSDVLVWVRPGAPRGERYALQMPDAKGTIYMAYPLAN